MPLALVLRRAAGRKTRTRPIVAAVAVGAGEEETRELRPLDVTAELQVVLAALLEEHRHVVADRPVVGILEASADAPAEGRRREGLRRTGCGELRTHGGTDNLLAALSEEPVRVHDVEDE